MYFLLEKVDFQPLRLMPEIPFPTTWDGAETHLGWCENYLSLNWFSRRISAINWFSGDTILPEITDEVGKSWSFTPLGNEGFMNL